MARIERITDASVRHYRDNGQTVAYVEWIDSDGQCVSTEEMLQHRCTTADDNFGLSAHMMALFRRAGREGVTIHGETW